MLSLVVTAAELQISQHKIIETTKLCDLNIYSLNKWLAQHTRCTYYWFILDPKSKQDKVKVTNLKNLPKLQIFEFLKTKTLRHIF